MRMKKVIRKIEQHRTQLIREATKDQQIQEGFTAE